MKKRQRDYDEDIARGLVLVLVFLSIILFAGIVNELGMWQACARHILNCS